MFTLMLLSSISLMIYPIVYGGEYRKLDQYTLAAVIGDEVVKKGLGDIGSIPGSVRVLPKHPGATMSIADVRTFNNTVMILVKDLKIAEKYVIGYSNSSTKRVYKLDYIVGEKINEIYGMGLDYFYSILMEARKGVPLNYYDEVRIPGVVSIDMPSSYYDVVKTIRPKLLCIVVGFVDDNLTNVYGPIIVYYFGIVVRGTLENGLTTKILIIYALVYDPAHLIYGEAYTVGYATYTYIGAGQLSSSTLFIYALGIYGIIGLVLTGFSFTIKPIEHDKFIALVAGLFILQSLSLLIIVRIMNIPLDETLEMIIDIGPWFHVIMFLWLPAYIVASYHYGYHSTSVTRELPSTPSLISRISLTAFSSLVLMLTLIFPQQFLVMLSSYMGLSALAFYIVLLSGVIAIIGSQLGILYAKTQRIKKEYTRVI